MADMNQKDHFTDNTEQIVEMQHLAVTTHSPASDSNSTSNHFEQEMEKDVIIDLKAIIEHGKDGLRSPRCCIYRVPQVIRDLKEDAYTPRVISIGPFHYGNVRLQEMESHKHVFFKRFTQEAKTSLDDLVNFARVSEPLVRASYWNNVELSEKELMKVILVDAGFIIELLKLNNEDQLENDAKLSQRWLWNAVQEDLLLLENQLPLFFLKDLFKKAFPHADYSFLELTYEFFDYFNQQKFNPDPNADITHFTDLLRLFYIQREKPKRNDWIEGNDTLSYSASELQEAGVKFKASTSKCLLDLKFIGHTLEVPKIIVDDSTETLFRNMIALEQCHYPFDSYITDYALVLDCLINTNKDVDVLIHKKIVHNSLAETNDVAKVFNGLWKNVVQTDLNSDYIDLCKRLNQFHENTWHKKKATLRRDYCKTPWQTTASIAGIVLLILTLIQTIFSVLQLVLKNN